MFRKILVAVDGSESAQRAVAAAAELAASLPGAEVALLTVSEPVPLFVVDELRANGLDPAVLQERHAEELLEAAAGPLRERGLDYVPLTAVGDPAGEICRAAQEGGYDLIVMGRRGLGPFQEMLAGSVSNKVVHRARRAVLIVQ
ncbi:MAG: universal stress protein [Clostridia bacterium]|nr:universal stress protein [Clostridia bacterium]MCL6522964.1 universal stress protein [Bacillota bacterium]